MNQTHSTSAEFADGPTFSPTHWSRADLLFRGWTPGLIARFLALKAETPDPGNHWFRPNQRTYRKTSVREVEKSQEFQVAFIRSKRRAGVDPNAVTDRMLVSFFNLPAADDDEQRLQLFLCNIQSDEIHYIIDQVSYDFRLFYERTNGMDLVYSNWDRSIRKIRHSCHHIDFDRVVIASPAQGTVCQAAKRLVGKVLETILRYSAQVHVRDLGAFSQSEFSGLLRLAKRRIAAAKRREERILQANREARPTEILELLAAANVEAYPSDTSPGFYSVICRRHYLDVHAPTNRFYCGYCRIGGGLEEVRDWLKDRKKGVFPSDRSYHRVKNKKVEEPVRANLDETEEDFYPLEAELTGYPYNSRSITITAEGKDSFSASVSGSMEDAFSYVRQGASSFRECTTDEPLVIHSLEKAADELRLDCKEFINHFKGGLQNDFDLMPSKVLKATVDDLFEQIAYEEIMFHYPRNGHDYIISVQCDEPPKLYFRCFDVTDFGNGADYRGSSFDDLMASGLEYNVQITYEQLVQELIDQNPLWRKAIGAKEKNSD